MTEEEWAKGMDARPMLNLLRDKATERKLRLFAVACCQSILLHLTDNRSLRGIAAAESYADSESSNNEFRRAAAQAFAASGEASGRFDNPHSLEARMLEFATRAASMTTNDGSIWRYASAAYQAAVHTADCVATARKFAPLGLGVKGGRPLARKERRFQAVLMSCIFGNPFRPVAFDPRWRTSDTVGLARGIYEERAFERMPILADALMDAGCADEQVLGHCRGDRPHARGCWVVDLVLGKE